MSAPNKIVHEGIFKTYRQICAATGIKHSTIRSRIMTLKSRKLPVEMCYDQEYWKQCYGNKKSKSSITVEFEGSQVTISELANLLGKSYEAIYRRFKANPDKVGDNDYWSVGRPIQSKTSNFIGVINKTINEPLNNYLYRMKI